MLTQSYAQTTNDPALLWAMLWEWSTREIRYREAHPDELPEGHPTLTQSVMARDAGDVCHVCGELVTWVDHLPPRDSGGAVRCFANVRTIGSPRLGVEIDDIFPRV
jgi:hypothetical protein